MKKALTLAMVLAIVCAMTVSVFAEGNHIINGATSYEVTEPVHVNVLQDTNHDTPVYSVDVKWDSLTFTYTEGRWNAEDLTYDGSWTAYAPTITVTNRSNAKVSITARFKDPDDGNAQSKTTNGVTASLDKANVVLNAATDGMTVADLYSGTFTVTVDEADKPTTNSAFDIGTIWLERALRA